MKGLYGLRPSRLWTNFPTDSQQSLLHTNLSPTTMSRFISRASQNMPFLVIFKLFNLIVALVAFSLLIWSTVSHDRRL